LHSNGVDKLSHPLPAASSFHTCMANSLINIVSPCHCYTHPAGSQNTVEGTSASATGSVNLVLTLIGGAGLYPFDKDKQQRLASIVATTLPLGPGKVYTQQQITVSEVSQTTLRARRRALMDTGRALVYQTTIGFGLQPTPTITSVDLHQAVAPGSGFMTRLSDALSKVVDWLVPGACSYAVLSICSHGGIAG
jgi:hypothetical protein